MSLLLALDHSKSVFVQAADIEWSAKLGNGHFIANLEQSKVMYALNFNDKWQVKYN